MTSGGRCSSRRAAAPPPPEFGVEKTDRCLADPGFVIHGPSECQPVAIHRSVDPCPHLRDSDVGHPDDPLTIQERDHPDPANLGVISPPAMAFDGRDKRLVIRGHERLHRDAGIRDQRASMSVTDKTAPATGRRQPVRRHHADHINQIVADEDLY